MSISRGFKMRVPCEAYAFPGQDPLTEREAELLQNVADGLTNREIGVKMILAEGTVRKNIEEIRFKLRAKNKAHIVTKGYQLGYLKVGG